MITVGSVVIVARCNDYKPNECAEDTAYSCLSCLLSDKGGTHTVTDVRTVGNELRFRLDSLGWTFSERELIEVTQAGPCKEIEPDKSLVMDYKKYISRL